MKGQENKAVRKTGSGLHSVLLRKTGEDEIEMRLNFSEGKFAAE